MSQYEWFIFSSIELFWELVSKFHIPYRLRYIKIDRFHALSIKHGQKWKKLYWLTFGSSEPIGEFISEIHLGHRLWYIKIDLYHELLWYIQAVWLMWVFSELFVVPVLSVSHLVTFIQVWLVLQIWKLKN